MSPSCSNNEMWYKPFRWRRADVRLWRVLVSHFRYKPFMWCRSDVRLRHALSLLSVISPLCGVAPTPDCGIIIPHFPLEESFRHSFGTSITILQFPLEASFRPSLGTQYLLSLCLIVLVNLFICFMLHSLYLMSELSCEYFHSTHLACWFGQMLTKAISWMKSLIARPMPRGVLVSPARSRILVTCFVYASATRNKSSRASLRRSMSCSLLESYHSLRDDISTTVIIVS